MTVRTSEAAIGQVSAALQALVDAGRAAAASAEADVGRMVQRFAEEAHSRRNAVQHARAAHDAALRALSGCQAAQPPVDCSAAATVAQAARKRLDEAEDRHRNAVACAAEAQELLLQQQTASRVLARALDVGARGAGEVRRLLDPITSYRSTATATSPAIAPRVAAPTVALTSDIELVDVDAIDDADSTVSGPTSFEKLRYEDAVWAAETVEALMVPAVRAGKDRGYFEQRDRDEGRPPSRSYARLFDTYFGSRAVSLREQADGRYGVNGGYHRIWATKQLGIGQLPARVRR